VANIVEGSVRKSGNRVRITIQQSDCNVAQASPLPGRHPTEVVVEPRRGIAEHEGRQSRIRDADSLARDAALKRRTMRLGSRSERILNKG